MKKPRGTEIKRRAPNRIPTQNFADIAKILAASKAPRWLPAHLEWWAQGIEAEIVRTIFRRYLDLQSFSKLVADLDRRGIVTKRRNTKVAKYNGAIPFTYGPLAYFLKNRIYLGEMHHGGKWFKGEHEAIVDRSTFDRVQQLLAANSQGRKVKRSESGALLAGKLYDDCGNRMSPSFSSKNGVRYRFYVSSALLRGRKEAAGSVSRIRPRKLAAWTLVTPRL